MAEEDYDSRCNCCAGVMGNAYCPIHATVREDAVVENKEDSMQYREVHQRYYVKRVLQCNRCGYDGVKWVKEQNDKWALYDVYSGKKHQCVK